MYRHGNHQWNVYHRTGQLDTLPKQRRYPPPIVHRRTSRWPGSKKTHCPMWNGCCHGNQCGTGGEHKPHQMVQRMQTTQIGPSMKGNSSTTPTYIDVWVAGKPTDTDWLSRRRKEKLPHRIKRIRKNDTTPDGQEDPEKRHDTRRPRGSGKTTRHPTAKGIRKNDTTPDGQGDPEKRYDTQWPSTSVTAYRVPPTAKQSKQEM